VLRGGEAVERRLGRGSSAGAKEGGGGAAVGGSGGPRSDMWQLPMGSLRRIRGRPLGPSSGDTHNVCNFYFLVIEENVLSHDALPS
jgi:hypothetical protein